MSKCITASLNASTDIVTGPGVLLERALKQSPTASVTIGMSQLVEHEEGAKGSTMAAASVNIHKVLPA